MKKIVLKGVKPLHPKQQQILDFLLTPDPLNIKLVDLACGRFFGKSLFGIILSATTLSLDSGAKGLFLEPDEYRLNAVFLEKWKKIIPERFYRLYPKERLITWRPTGATLRFGIRNITGNYSASDDSKKGSDLTFIVDDETALRCSIDFYNNNIGALRAPSPYRYYLTESTPALGAYRRLITSFGHKLFTGTSYDNIYRTPGTIERLKQSMAAEVFRREVMGEFIALQGKIWKDWDSSIGWPYGNLHDYSFNRDKPYYLFCDYGSGTGAYAVVQSTDSYYQGQMRFRGPVWVILADFCPLYDANAQRAFTLIRNKFGNRVAGVVGGKDINKKADTDSRTIAYLARNVFGDSVPIYEADERDESKQIQGDCLSGMIKTIEGVRRLCISKDFVSLDDESHRGVRELFEEDEWPRQQDRRDSDLYPKGKKYPLSHIRDALMMGAVKIMNPPDWTYNSDRAA
jgi:hypothetical protein